MCFIWCLNNASSVYNGKHRFEFKSFPYKLQNPELILTEGIENYAEVACRQHSCKSVQIASTQQTTILGFLLHRLERGLAVI
jgi:hypothetical protein